MAANAPDARLRMRNAVPGPRGGGLYLSEAQRTRLLDAAFEVVAEDGYRGMAVRAVCERAGVSSKTFYDLFEGREGCFLAAFDHGVEQLTEVARPAYEAEKDWVAGVRAGLAALLVLLDEEPALCGLVFVEALGVGPRVLARRAEVLDGVAGRLDEGREGATAAAELPQLTGLGVVGAAFSVVHARLIEQHGEPLVGLLGELMAMIVLPYRGRAAAAHELTRPALELPAGAAVPDVGRQVGPVSLGGFRLTVRRHAVLSAVAELCAGGLEPCNREVCGRVGIADQSQVSRLMMGLEAEGLVENTRTGVVGTRKAWRVTAQGWAVLDANPPLKREDRLAGKGGSAAAARRQRGTRTFSSVRKSPAGVESPVGLAERQTAPPIAGLRPLGSVLPADFRLTVRAQMALQAVAQSSARATNPSNLEVAKRIGVSGKSTISHLMSRPQEQGLVENTRGNTKGLEKAWRLTPQGEAVLDAHRPHRARGANEPTGIRGGKLAAKRSRPRSAPVRPASAGFRLTVRTHLVLTAVAEHAGASNREVARAAGVRDEGQISKLLARLQDRGLIHNTARATPGTPKAWRLTPEGEALLHTSRTPGRRAA